MIRSRAPEGARHHTTRSERYRSGRNGGASKASCPVRGTWVRIPPSPPIHSLGFFPGIWNRKRQAIFSPPNAIHSANNPAFWLQHQLEVSRSWHDQGDDFVVFCPGQTICRNETVANRLTECAAAFTSWRSVRQILRAPENPSNSTDPSPSVTQAPQPRIYPESYLWMIRTWTFTDDIRGTFSASPCSRLLSNNGSARPAARRGVRHFARYSIVRPRKQRRTGERGQRVVRA